MSPHLTIRGVWVFIGALIFIGAGALAERPVLLMMGEVMIGVLAISFFLCIAAALALDRRFISITCSDAVLHEPIHISRAITGEPLILHFIVHNFAWVPLYGLRIMPFGALALDAEASSSQFHLPSGARIGMDIQVISWRTGRWCLHGFDVRVADPLGLLATRDYLPCTHVVESFGAMNQAWKMKGRDFSDMAPRYGVRHSRHSGHGSQVRELREYQSGDPLRYIAWKASARARRLISRDFEREINFNVYLLLDISTSMRGGAHPGQKLEHGISMVTELAESVSSGRDQVGLMTFDEKLYGHIRPGTSMAHLGQLMRHLVGLNAVVDPDLSQWSEAELLTRLADYLLVQERLDFRRGADPHAEAGVNRQLMERWIHTVLPADRARFDSAVLHDGVLEPVDSPLRQFAQLRGLAIPYRTEARPGLKEMGLAQAIEQLVHAATATQLIVIITDLCSITNPDRLTRTIRLAKLKGHTVHFLVPFTPAYHHEPTPDQQPHSDANTSPSNHQPTSTRRSHRYRIVREIFAIQEREDRLKIAASLRTLGVQVDFLKPGQSAMQLLNQPGRSKLSG